MLKANENVERETVAECILLHPAILVKGSDSKLRRFDAAAVQKVFRELHHKRLGQYSTPNGVIDMRGGKLQSKMRATLRISASCTMCRSRNIRNTLMRNR